MFVCVCEECVLEDCEMKQIVVVCCDFVELCDCYVAPLYVVSAGVDRRVGLLRVEFAGANALSHRCRLAFSSSHLGNAIDLNPLRNVS